MFFLEVRIISPTGRLLTVNRAVPIVETIFDFNGESRFLGDICRNGTKPNGIAILYDSSSIFEDNLSELVVGNLQSDVVEQIMQSLMVNGYYDFSQMGYQSTKLANKVVIDGGKSKPYTNEITFMSSKSYCSFVGNGFVAEEFTEEDGDCE